MTDILRIPLLGATLALVAFVSNAHAQWQPHGTTLYWGATGYPVASLDPDPAGGHVVPFDCTVGGMRLQKLRRVTATGMLDPAWSTPPLGEPGAIRSDGTGGYFVLQRGAPAGGSVFAYRLRHLLPSGALDPAWPDSGALVSAQVLDASKPQIVPDGAGGAYVIYEFWRDTPPTASAIHLAHFAAGGATAPGWPVGGVRLLDNSFSGLAQGLAGDGAGGVFAVVASFLGSSVRLVAHHWRADGTVDPNWTTAGIGLGTWPFSAEPIRLVSHGSDASLVWRTGLPNAPATGVLRFDARLDLGEHWLAVVPMGIEVGEVNTFDDGSGGLYLFWLQRLPTPDVRGVRFNGRGAFVPGWDSATASRLPADADLDRDDTWAAGPAADGGVVIAWPDQRNGFDSIYVVRRTGSGDIAPGWPASGEVLPVEGGLPPSPTTRGHVLAARADGFGRAYVVWRNGNAQNDVLYLARVEPRPPLEAPDPIAALALLLGPNPARAAFSVTLATPAPGPSVSLELIDAAGRRLRAASFPAGARTVRWSLGADIRPGVHFVRLSQGGRSLTRRIALIP